MIVIYVIVYVTFMYWLFSNNRLAFSQVTKRTLKKKPIGINDIIFQQVNILYFPSSLLRC